MTHPVTETCTSPEFANAQIYGVVQADFFDWLLDVDGGEEIIANIARRIAQFDWSITEHDVLKLLYESVIDADDRRSLGEYYTPDWLAQVIVDSNVSDPLNQRVADVAAGSGTFLYHAVRRYLSAAEEAGLSVGAAISGVTTHVTGMDVHPVAVTIARVTYLLAIGTERLKSADRGPVVVPVYLGDSLQWEQQHDVLSSRDELRVSTAGTDLVGEGGALFSDDLVFPQGILADASRFDQIVGIMSELSSDSSGKTSSKLILPVLHKFGVPDDEVDVMIATFDAMRRLHTDGRDGIWGYYVRNLVRPTWLAFAENQVDVLVGNPPWLRYASMTEPMQQRFTHMLRERGLVSGRAGASARDLSTLFLARSAELYLKPGGRFAFILPNGVLTRQPHAAFRSGLWEGKNFRLKAEFDTAWDLAGAATGFPNHAAVVSGSRSETAKPISSTVEKWVTTGTKSAVTWDEMLPRLSRVPSEVGVTGGAVDEYFSPYKSRFRQGAVLAPLVSALRCRRSGEPARSGRRAPVGPESPYEPGEGSLEVAASTHGRG